VRQFVTADTAGNEAAAEAFVLPLGDGTPYCELATDSYAITDSVRVESSVVHGDTAIVVVAYHVLGHAWSEDSHKVGSRAGRFHAEDQMESVTFYVVRDSTGRLGIDCDHRVPLNHPSVAHATGWLRNLDPASAAAWDSVSSRSSSH
jgi:hypothetical protein